MAITATAMTEAIVETEETAAAEVVVDAADAVATVAAPRTSRCTKR